MVLNLSDADHANERMVYLSPYSLLVSTRDGLRRVHCPFTVYLRDGIGIKTVTKVGSNSSGMLVFMVNGEWFECKIFCLKI